MPPYFDFGDSSSSNSSKKNNSSNKKIKIYPEINYFEKQKQQEQKPESTWVNVVKSKPKPKPEPEPEPEPKKYVYLYDSEVDLLVKTMNWGDFECMMDDVIIVPEGEKKPDSKL